MIREIVVLSCMQGFECTSLNYKVLPVQIEGIGVIDITRSMRSNEISAVCLGNGADKVSTRTPVSVIFRL